MGHSSTIKVTWVHRDTRELATAYIQIGNEHREWKLTIIVVPDLFVPLILGSYWPGFPKELPVARKAGR